MTARLWALLGHRWAGPASLLLAIVLAGLALGEVYAGWRQSYGLQARIAAADAEIAELRRLAREVKVLRSTTVPAVSGSPLSRIEQILNRHQVRALVADLRPEGETYVLDFRPVDFAALARVIADIESAALVIQSARLERTAELGRITAQLRIALRP